MDLQTHLLTREKEMLHPDDLAVDVFATKLKAKLKFAREERGKEGWQMSKCDPIDVALYCMFFSARNENIKGDFNGQV